MIPKFKAYDLTENEWINLGRIVLCEKGELLYLQGLDENFKDIDPPYFKEDLGKVWVLLQSTGLFDKNGKEIYKGDILHHKVQGTAVVIYPFMDDMASFGTINVNNGFGNTLQDAAKAGYEIIGNKFEHPHLLGEE